MTPEELKSAIITHGVMMALAFIGKMIKIHPMDVKFRDKKLDQLESDASYSGAWTDLIVSAFRKRMQVIRSAPDERVFYALKSLHFEKLKGTRSNEHSMRLNDQWRLILEFEGKGESKVVAIISIEDYH